MRNFLIFLFALIGVQGYGQTLASRFPQIEGITILEVKPEGGQPLQFRGEYPRTKNEIKNFIKGNVAVRYCFAKIAEYELKKGGYEFGKPLTELIDEIFEYIEIRDTIITGGFVNSLVYNGSIKFFLDNHILKEEVGVLHYKNVKFPIFKTHCSNLLIPLEHAQVMASKVAPAVVSEPSPTTVINNYYYGDTTKRDVTINNINVVGGGPEAATGGQQEYSSYMYEEPVPVVYRHYANVQAPPVVYQPYAYPVQTRQPFFINLALNFGGRGGGGYYPPQQNYPPTTTGGPVTPNGWGDSVGQPQNPGGW